MSFLIRLKLNRSKFITLNNKIIMMMIIANDKATLVTPGTSKLPLEFLINIHF